MPFCPKCGTDVVEGARFCPNCGNTMPRPEAVASPQDPYLGRKLDDKYMIEELLGVGGMGRVYRAVQLSLEKKICVKVLRTGATEDETLARRFHREARAASRLNHPNSISVIDFGQTAADGSLYMAMEFIPGRDLGKIIREDFPLGEQRVVHIMDQVLSALADAHAADIVHRDLKPENIMVTDLLGTKDFVKVLDFGIAKIQETSQDPGLTQAGMVCGTPEYMSPEQARGEPLDARSDLYAAGVILYQMITGRLPFQAPTAMGIVTKHLVEPPVPPSQLQGVRVSPAMEAVILKAMSKDRNGRQPTALALQQELNAVLNQKVAPAQQPPQGDDLFADAPASAVASAGKPAAEASAKAADPGPTVLRADGTGGTDEVRAAPAPASAPPPPKGTGKGWLWFLLFLVVVLGGGGAAIYFLAFADDPAAPDADAGVAPAADAGAAPAADAGVVPAADAGAAPAADAGVAPKVDAGVAPAADAGAVPAVDAGTVAAAADAGQPPEPGPVVSDTARMHYQAGKELMARRKYSKAIKAFRRALRASPDYAEAYKALGTCYISVGRVGLAKKALKTYLKKKPDAADRQAIQDMIEAF